MNGVFKFVFVVMLCTIANLMLADLVNFRQFMGLAVLIAAGAISFKDF